MTTTMHQELAGIVELLGQLWLHEVSRDTLTAMKTDAFSERYQELGGFLPEIVDEATLEGLSVEYCSLLIGPQGQISPVQSVWTADRFQGDSSGEMNRIFELLPGFKPGSNLSDHVGVQLNFLGAVLELPDPSISIDVANHFVENHLGWTFEFLNKIESSGRSKFYEGLAAVTRAMLSQFPWPLPSLTKPEMKLSG